MMTWEDFKLKFSKYHVPQGLIKKMRDEFRELKQGRMSVVEYRDRFLTLSRYAPDETDTNEKRKESFLNGLHDEMQTVLVNIPFADLEALVDSAIQMEGKLHQANENRKRRMMNQNGPHHTQKHRNNSSGGFTPRNNRPPAQTYRPNSNNNRGPPKPGGNNNNNRNPNSHHNNGNNTNTNTGPRIGSNAIPVTPKDKSTVSCYECGVVGHFSKECPKKLAKIAANTAAPVQQQRRFAGRRNQNNNNGRFYHMTATEAQEAPQTLTTRSRRSPQILAIDPRLPKLRHCTRSLYHLANVASTLAIDRRRPTAPSDPLGEYDQEKMVIFDIKLMVGFGCDTIPILKVPPQYPKWMDGREGEKKRLLQETGFSSGTCAVPDEKKHRVEEVSQFDGRFEDESQFDAPVDGTDDEPFIDEGPAPEIIQPTEGGRGPSTQLCVEVDARPEIITGVRVVSRPPSPDAPVDGTDDEPLIDEGPAPEIIQPTEGGRGPSTQLCVEEDAHPEIIRGVPVVSGPPSPDAKC
ncbi:hypothetical protein QYE76_029711 [Lolium multiflorum]|uniref:CCHC-type domain-containing protein n=1 Tax=Lolium multiflorum TaxID=4521 RepID=A0AAD8QND3_LOLMU|nr:hypothetical protein QYE76_029711 [Lolium multiflorum]